MYDVFISYRRDGGYEMARLLYEHLKKYGLNPFFDLEELRSGPFNTKLYEVIENSSNFLLILPPLSLERCKNEGDWLRLEIEHAIQYDKNIIPVMMKNFEWPNDLPKSIEIISKYNGLEMSREYFNASIDKIISLLKNIGHRGDKKIDKEHTYQPSVRNENTYFSANNIKELKRLKVQQNLMEGFDKETYNKIIERYDDIRVLDIGSNNGDLIMNRIAKNGRVSLVVGLEYDLDIVNRANDKYNDDNAFFYQINVESDELCDKLDEILLKHQIDNFNVINLSMIILHLKNPFKVLKTIRKYLASDGSVIIRDIDDGLNYAYPDENGNFARVINICKQNETSGYRESGRQIYTLLKRTGYADIVLEKVGLSTIGMDFEEKEALFDTYFSFILDDCKIMTERYPNNENYLKDYNWYKNIYNDLEERFQDDAFAFSLGFMLYTARKKHIE